MPGYTWCPPAIPRAHPRGRDQTGRLEHGWLETLNTQAASTLTGYRIMVRHMAGLIGNVKLVDLKVRDVDVALGKLAKRLATGA